MMTDSEKRQKAIKEWLEKKHVEYMGKRSAYISQSEMAEILGIDRAVFNRYYNGLRLPTGDNVDKIASVFGSEIYNILSIANPDPLIQYITRNWDKLPPEEQKRFRELVEKYADEPAPDPAPKADPRFLKPKTA